jgi:FKBP-type peptidyl-prolyl cis-trans isomerase 2
MKVEKNDTVRVNYVGKFENGEIFDTSYEEKAKEAGIHVPGRDYSSLEIKVGAAQVIKGFDDALLGMEPGEKKEIKIPPEDAYGDKRPELVQSLPMELFTQNNITPEEGMRLNTSQGIAEIVKVNDEEVTLDFNHPLAGKTICFEIQVEDLKKA